MIVLSGALLLLAPMASSAQTCAPSVTQTLGVDPHHTTIAGGNGKDGTQLASHDTIIIQARIPTDPTGSPGTCRSITNNSNVSYFVPWGSPTEWADFLNAVTSHQLTGVSIGNCCPPDATETICGKTIGAMNGSGNNNLGARWLGLPAMGITSPITANDVPYYGGQNDVVGPIYACNALGVGVDYAVTFVCQNGSWVQTHSDGSCTPLDGVCGAIPAGGFTILPADLTTLCAAGSILQNLTGTGPWNWDCYGTLGTAHCSAPVYAPTDGACGTSNGAGLKSAPTSNLCTSGTVTGVTADGSNSHWLWTCNGIDGGSSATCSAVNVNPAGACGPANGGTSFTTPSLPADLCAAGDTISPVTETASGIWQWTCYGPGGGPAAFCSEINGNGAGICGGDSGRTLMSTPTALCGSGTPGPVTDEGGLYWDWYCFQLGNPTGTYCKAFNVGAPTCGAINGTSISTPPTSLTMCSSGIPFGLVTLPDRWNWQCTTTWPSAVDCSANNTFAPINGACGGATGVPVLTAPTTGLCWAGTASAVSGSGPWTWTCAGVNGGADTMCTAPLLASQDGACGTADGTAIPNTPNINLCSTGTASVVSGSGPWNWTCFGAGTGTNASCSAFLCNECSGTIMVSQSLARSGTDGSCHVNGVAGWNETYSLVTSNIGLSPLTLQWSDIFGSVTGTINQNAAPWPQYCAPCYLKHLGATNIGMSISSDNGSCAPGESAGSFIPAGSVTLR